MIGGNEWMRIKTFTILLLLAQLVAVVLAWSLNPIGQRAETSFALLLAVNLVSFSMVSYINRKRKMAEGVRGGMLVVGSAVVLVFVFLVLLV